MAAGPLTPTQLQTFQRDGAVLLEGFFDVEQELLPIHRAIHEIIGLVADRHSIELTRAPFESGRFDDGFMTLVKANRAYGGEVYDVIKQIPAFLRLASSIKLEELLASLRGTDLVGVGAASYGIRIDLPDEDKFRSEWHQEFLFQPQSEDGIVCWLPLVPMTDALGPVRLCTGSHLDGLQRYKRTTTGKTGAYQLSIDNAEQVTGAYPQVAPLSKPGDLLVMDYLTIHQSGFNVSDRPRWSMQTRFFNFRDPSGSKTGWKASITAGTRIEELFPDHIIADEGH